MLLTLGEFRDRVGQNLDGLIGELQDPTSRYGNEEHCAKRASMPTNVPGRPLILTGRGQLAAEYPLPAAAAWRGVMLPGAADGWPSAAEALIGRHGGAVLTRPSRSPVMSATAGGFTRRRRGAAAPK